MEARSLSFLLLLEGLSSLQSPCLAKFPGYFLLTGIRETGKEAAAKAVCFNCRGACWGSAFPGFSAIRSLLCWGILWDALGWSGRAWWLMKHAGQGAAPERSDGNLGWLLQPRQPQARPHCWGASTAQQSLPKPGLCSNCWALLLPGSVRQPRLERGRGGKSSCSMRNSPSVVVPFLGWQNCPDLGHSQVTG